jgi:hypothetical protein
MGHAAPLAIFQKLAGKMGAHSEKCDPFHCDTLWRDVIVSARRAMLEGTLLKPLSSAFQAQGVYWRDASEEREARA